MSLISTLKFFLSEAFINIRRAGVMTVITVTTIAVALLLMGAFLIATMHTEVFLAKLQSEALVTAFLYPQTPQDVIASVKMQLTAMEEVADVVMVTPEDAVKELFVNPEDRKLLEIGIGEKENPLPTTFRIKVRSSRDLEPLLSKLKAINAIETVGYGEEAFRQFQGLSELLWLASTLIIALLGIASLFIVFNTIRMTLHMREEEITIMRLVGATNWFIRWPFVFEGFFHGVFGAILAIAFLFIGHNFILVRLSTLIPVLGLESGISHLFKLFAKLFMMGIVLGISGSLLSLRDLRSFGRNR